MSQNNKHPAALKLFGMKIPVPEINIPADSQLPATGVNEKRAKLEHSQVKDSDKQDRASILGDDKEASDTLGIATTNHVNPQPEGEQENPSSCEQEKVVKKPDKIVPCPRCNSFDTKFCYFNNYNVNQPRHFCKSCQRYWTAGGTIRNVPVGAGRKKTKQLASQYHQILLSSDSISANKIETSDMVSQQLISSGESTKDFLKFGSVVPLSESMRMVPNLGDPNRCGRGSVACRENGEKPYSCGTSVAPSSNSSIESNENSHQRDHNDEGGSCDQFKQMPTLNYYPWNSGLNNGASMTSIQKQPDQVYASNSSSSNPVEWCSGPLLALPGLCGPTMPLHLVPAPYIPLLPTVGGNASLTASGGCISPTSSTNNSCCSSNGLPSLAKHSRDRNLEEKTETVLLPKTPKIDDQHNTLKSPLSATVGTNPDQKKL